MCVLVAPLLFSHCVKSWTLRKFTEKWILAAAPESDQESAAGKRARQGITPDMIKELTDCNTRLSAQRKKRQVCA